MVRCLLLEVHEGYPRHLSFWFNWCLGRPPKATIELSLRKKNNRSKVAAKTTLNLSTTRIRMIMIITRLAMIMLHMPFIRRPIAWRSKMMGSWRMRVQRSAQPWPPPESAESRTEIRDLGSYNYNGDYKGALCLIIQV